MSAASKSIKPMPHTLQAPVMQRPKPEEEKEGKLPRVILEGMAKILHIPMKKPGRRHKPLTHTNPFGGIIEDQIPQQKDRNQGETLGTEGAADTARGAGMQGETGTGSFRKPGTYGKSAGLTGPDSKDEAVAGNSRPSGGSFGPDKTASGPGAHGRSIDPRTGLPVPGPGGVGSSEQLQGAGLAHHRTGDLGIAGLEGKDEGMDAAGRQKSGVEGQFESGGQYAQGRQGMNPGGATGQYAQGADGKFPAGSQGMSGSGGTGQYAQGAGSNPITGQYGGAGGAGGQYSQEGFEGRDAAGQYAQGRSGQYQSAGGYTDQFPGPDGSSGQFQGGVDGRGPAGQYTQGSEGAQWSGGQYPPGAGGPYQSGQRGPSEGGESFDPSSAAWASGNFPRGSFPQGHPASTTDQFPRGASMGARSGDRPDGLSASAQFAGGEKWATGGAAQRGSDSAQFEEGFGEGQYDPSGQWASGGRSDPKKGGDPNTRKVQFDESSKPPADDQLRESAGPDAWVNRESGEGPGGREDSKPKGYYLNAEEEVRDAAARTEMKRPGTSQALAAERLARFYNPERGLSPEPSRPPGESDSDEEYDGVVDEARRAARLAREKESEEEAARRARERRDEEERLLAQKTSYMNAKENEAKNILSKYL